jgi:hypothetical protein
MGSTTLESLVLVDTHVHLHEQFSWEAILTAAAHNFSNIVQTWSESTIGTLCIMDMADQCHFLKIKESFGSNSKHGDWNFQNTCEPFSLVATHPSNIPIAVVAGRQIITAENLEVLSLFSSEIFNDGQPIRETLNAINRSGAIAILPWGVGKWIGRRGAVLKQLIQEPNSTSFFLGDNGGRPVFWPQPSIFQKAIAKGIKILPGTDPLPLASEVSRPGSFGLKLQETLNLARPGSHLKQLLLDPQLNFEPYGALDTPLNFISKQILIRI